MVNSDIAISRSVGLNNYAYPKIPNISPGLINIRKHFLKGLHSGGAYIRREICVSDQGGLYSEGGLYSGFYGIRLILKVSGIKYLLISAYDAKNNCKRCTLPVSAFNCHCFVPFVKTIRTFQVCILHTLITTCVNNLLLLYHFLKQPL